MKPRYIIFVLAALLLFQTRSISQDTNWVKTNTWYFDNYSIPELKWPIFRETFIGVAPEPSGDTDPAFYALYETLAKPGNCFGICVMALLMKKNGGYLGFCHPPNVYSGTIFKRTTPEGLPSNDTVGPDSKKLKIAIAIVHGNQINHGFLAFLVDILKLKKQRDGMWAYGQLEYYMAKDDPPIISITKTWNPIDGGHALIPYYIDSQSNKDIIYIYVYDPNHSYYEPGTNGRKFYTDKLNYIEINRNDNSWKYNKDYPGTNSWSGNPGSGGNIIVIPLSVAGKKDRLPQSLLAEGALALEEIFTFGKGEEEQISNVLINLLPSGDDVNNFESNQERRLNYVNPLIPVDVKDLLKSTLQNNLFFSRGSDQPDCGTRVDILFK